MLRLSAEKLGASRADNARALPNLGAGRTRVPVADVTSLPIAHGHGVPIHPRAVPLDHAAERATSLRPPLVVMRPERFDPKWRAPRQTPVHSRLRRSDTGRKPSTG